MSLRLDICPIQNSVQINSSNNRSKIYMNDILAKATQPAI